MSRKNQSPDIEVPPAGDGRYLTDSDEAVIVDTTEQRLPDTLKAVIFDYDGVIALSEAPRFRVLRDYAFRYGIDITDDMYSGLAGRTTRTFLSETFPDAPTSDIEEIIRSYSREFKGNITKYVEPVEFVVNYIRNYRGKIAFALASMSDRAVIETVTRHLGIYNRFDSMTCKEDVAHPKPHPEIYLRTLADLRITPTECIAIEDTRVGILSPLRAGIMACALMNGTNSEADFTDLNVPFIKTKEDLDSLITFKN